MEPIQMHLSKKLSKFSQIFTAFLKSTFNFQHFEVKDELDSLCISEVIDVEKHGYGNVYRVTFQYTLGQSTC